MWFGLGPFKHHALVRGARAGNGGDVGYCGDDHDSGSKNCDDDEAAAMVIAAMGLVREVDTMAIAMITVTLRERLC